MCRTARCQRAAMSGAGAGVGGCRNWLGVDSTLRSASQPTARQDVSVGHETLASPSIVGRGVIDLVDFPCAAVPGFDQRTAAPAARLGADSAVAVGQEAPLNCAVARSTATP